MIKNQIDLEEINLQKCLLNFESIHEQPVSMPWKYRQIKNYLTSLTNIFGLLNILG